VSWGVGDGYVGWCPLGYRDRPVYAWGGHNRGYAVPRRGGHGGWNVVREGDFGHRDVARQRVPLAGIDHGALRVAESPNLRPTRNGRSLVASNPTARAISRRPTPGDFVRELAVDNKTTIPSPWLSRGRARAEESRARQSQDQATAARPRRGASEAGAPRAGSTALQGRESRQRDTQALRRGEASRSTARPESTYRPRAGRAEPSVREQSGGQSSLRGVSPRQDADRGGSLGGQARYRSPSPRRDASSSSRPQASRSEPRTPRAEASSRPSRSDSGARSSDAQRSSSAQRSGGEQQRSGSEQQRSSDRQHSGNDQRSAPRPPRNSEDARVAARWSAAWRVIIVLDGASRGTAAS
jgi:hypothetical protein